MKLKPSMCEKRASSASHAGAPRDGIAARSRSASAVGAVRTLQAAAPIVELERRHRRVTFDHRQPRPLRVAVERLAAAVELHEAIEPEAAIGERVRDLVREQEALALQRLGGGDEQALGAGIVIRHG